METIQQGIAELQVRVSNANIPASRPDNFRLLTWNIRNFNADKEDRAIKYYAAIISNFDVIAIQECKDSLGGVERLQKELGTSYRFLFSDTSGNGERLLFIYNTSKVEFTGLAAEVVLDPGAGKDDNVKPELEFDRTPYMASFRVKGCNFILVTVHIYYGSGSKVKYRLVEIKNVAKYLQKVSGDTDALDSDYIICGDFNIEDVRAVMQADLKKKKKPSTGDADPVEDLFDALLSGGLIVPDDIRNSPTNLSQDKHYDQIAFMKYKDSTVSFVKGGVIDFNGAVYVGDPKLRFKFTDHLPMWAVFDTKPDKKPKYINP